VTAPVDRTDLVLDVDTGIDDAMAIALALAARSLRVRAITCVAGNTDVDQVVRNTLTVLDVLGAPVATPPRPTSTSGMTRWPPTSCSRAGCGSTCTARAGSPRRR
jgi:inosine-uridine nucleoside N-ribohydrolase